MTQQRSQLRGLARRFLATLICATCLLLTGPVTANATETKKGKCGLTACINTGGLDLNDSEYWIQRGREQRAQIAKRESYRVYKIQDACSTGGTLTADDCMKNKVTLY